MAGKGLSVDQEEFLTWLLLDKRTRQVQGLPLTQAAWAEWKGLTDRTVRRWKQKPDFEALLEQRKIENARRLMPNSTVAAGAGGARAATDARSKRRFQPPGVASESDDPTFQEDLDPDEQDYRQIKDGLVRLAKGGDARASELYFKTYGKQFVEAEASAGERLQALDDGGLADEFVSAIGPDRVAAALARATAA